MYMLSLIFRTVHAKSKDEVLFITRDQHSQPLEDKSKWMETLKEFPVRPGPRFPDGSINWQCPCMANGSLVAHRCGHFFRQLYICMSENNNEDVVAKCPDQFVDWSACMQNVSEERREQMRRAIRQPEEQIGIEAK